MQAIITYLENISHTIPLPIYTSIGGLIEEIIAPIPSPLVMTSAGTIAHEQGHTALYIVFISLLAAVGKTIGAYVIYYLADITEDLMLTRFGKFLGISHKEVEKFGSKFNNTIKDDLILIFLRAVPIFPGAPVAAVCGLIKLNLRTYIQSTFIGVWIRSMIFGFIGFYGKSQLNNYIASWEDIGNAIFITSVVSVGLYFVYTRKGKLEELALTKLKIFEGEEEN